MQTHCVHINNPRLREGETHDFRIEKLVSLDDATPMFVLKDPNGYKVLLPAKHYNEYGFTAGQTIQCRVDKINCNGKMFLEPLHPFYMEGNDYSFPVLCRGHRKDILNQDEWYFLVIDIYGNPWKVRSSSEELWMSRPTAITCEVKRIKKGKLFLTISGESGNHPNLKNGKIYDFQIVGEKKHPDNDLAHFILQDKDGNLHLLKKKYYLHFGFKHNQWIRCKVDKLTTEGFYFLEPDHPCYSPGKAYDFPVIRKEKRIFSDHSTQLILILEDCFGEEISVNADPMTAGKAETIKKVTASVGRIRKSRLELKDIQWE